ncbi:MAG: agmatine deiminase family protein [Bacteroidaceae bacterium]|nr:agmatine deiminase family protein [Bacteroidaceae bacterium]
MKSEERRMNQPTEKIKSRCSLPAEWEPQSMVQLTWPHENTDWAEILDEVYECFIHIAREVAKRERLLVVTPHPTRVEEQLRQAGVRMEHITLFQCPTNDTWARDHGFITVLQVDKTQVDELTRNSAAWASSTRQLVNLSTKIHLDFCFNGWGMKFASNLDNQINSRLHKAGVMEGEYVDCLDFVLEGGSIESDGMGTLLTTSHCLLAPNRNARHTTKEALEQKFSECFGTRQVLWLDHGYLAGDDTDSHVDTLTRLCPDDTIAYVQCTDKTDEHYTELHLMEEQLKTFRTLDGRPYRLVPLPMTDAVVEDGERLPATYANFLIMNGAVLYPTYNQSGKDTLAGKQLQSIFPDREVVGIDCRALIRQHGSLHCVTMQYPK